MCGIAGLINTSSVPVGELSALKGQSLQSLSRGMLGLLSHRGPDEMGTVFFEQGFLSNARLSIIDIEKGTQPVSNEDESVWIVYNGEVYDVDRHIRDLKAKGHVFQSRSDTEVLVHLYEEYGPSLTRHINGEYAFVIFDRKKNAFFLFRDSFGTKPLYYQELEKGVYLFASEIKPLLWATVNSKPQLSSLGISQTLEGWATIPPTTPFEDICQLPPQHYAELHNKEFRIFPHAPRGVAHSTGNIEALLRQAVERRLRADVPVGIYLSGGLDSSIIASLASEISSHRLSSFSIEFEDDQFDEKPDQAILQEQLGTKHHALRVSRSAIADNFREAVLAAESTVFRTAFVPMFLLSRLVRESGLKVVLTGEGSDELFGGYDIYREFVILREWAKDPNSSEFPGLLKKIYHYLPEFQGAGARLMIPFYRKFLEGIEEAFGVHQIRWSNYQHTRQLLQGRGADEPTATALRKLLGSKNPEELCRLAECFTLLHGYLLSTQGDRMASAHSVEVRIPFLDVDVSGYAFQRPVTSFVENLTDKALLRRTFASRLPEQITQKPKTPYLAPDVEVFFGASSTFSWKDYVNKKQIEASSVFDTEKVLAFINRVETQYQRNGRISRRDNTSFFSLLSSLILHNDIGLQLSPKNIEKLVVKERHLGEHTEVHNNRVAL